MARMLPSRAAVTGAEKKTPPLMGKRYSGHVEPPKVALAALAARCAGTGPSPMRLVAPDVIAVGLNPLTMSQTAD